MSDELCAKDGTEANATLRASAAQLIAIDLFMIRSFFKFKIGLASQVFALRSASW